MKILKLVILLMSSMTFANIHLPSIFSDNMVLQRNSEVTVWGSAETSESIALTADFLDKEYKITVGKDATFSITFKTPKEGGPYTIRIKGNNELILKNIMIGEVWLMSGQSNMEMTAGWGISDGETEIKNSNTPDIRFFSVSKAAADGIQHNAYDAFGGWVPSTPETMKNFSAIGYFFAKKLQSELNVPVGVICAAWGGTAAEFWAPKEVFQQHPEYIDAYRKMGDSPYYPTILSGAYNAMIAPFDNFKIAGVGWYQGESSTANADNYTGLMTDLISSWRKSRGYDFPFYIIQIAPFPDKGEGNLKIRNAQRIIARTVPQSGLIVSSDVSETDNIHPKNKKPLGIRMADLALKYHYGVNNQLVESPDWSGIEYKGKQVVLTLKFAEGLHFRKNSSPLFEIAAADGRFYPAKAIVKGNQIILSSSSVKKPEKVRYQWNSVAFPDVFNKAGLPASVFTSE